MTLCHMHSTTIALFWIVNVCVNYFFVNVEAFVGTRNKKILSQQKQANVNFEEWISDSPQEVAQKKELIVEGKIPFYLHGSLIRNGGGKWTNGEDMHTHIFDGLAKVSMYDIQPTSAGIQTTMEDDHSNSDADINTKVYFQTRFIQSKWYKKVLGDKGLPPFISMGPIANKKSKEKKVGSVRSIIATMMNMLQFDNACVNIWDYSNRTSGGVDEVSALTDAPPRAQISTKDLSTISTSAQTPPTDHLLGLEFSCTTHPEYSKIEKGVTYNAGVEIGLTGAKVILTKETKTSRRVIGRSDAVEGIPYFHSFGINGEHATVVLQPLRANLDVEKISQEGYFTAMDQLDYTQVLVFNLESGDVVLNQKIDEKIYFYHTISAAEDLSSDRPNVSIRLCAYKTPHIMTSKDKFMMLDKCKGESGKENRDRISEGGTVCVFVCNLNDSSVDIHWKDDITQGFELPTTRYSRASGDSALTVRHPRFVYAYSAYANGSRDYDSWGLFKFDMEKNCVDSFYQQESRYVSEPIFVADPNGIDEDDGVVLSQVYDGIRRETGLLVLDAKNMSVLASAWTGQRTPMDFHGTFIEEIIPYPT